MAIAFELVINFGSDQAAAAAARHLTVKHPPLTAGQHHVRMHEPLLTTVRGYHGQPHLEMSILPIGVGWAVALDRQHERLRLTAAELATVGRIHVEDQGDDRASVTVHVRAIGWSGQMSLSGTAHPWRLEARRDAGGWRVWAANLPAWCGVHVRPDRCG
ncbi:hypothetical protein ACVCAH_35040 [Micromonospora sp. LZ34]